MFRFDSITLNECKPIGNLTIDFPVNIIAILGRNGSGKTALVAALKTGIWSCGGTVKVMSRGNSDELLQMESLVFIGEKQMFDVPSELLPLYIKNELTNPKYLNRLDKLVSELNEPKLSKKKFHGLGIGEQTILNLAYIMAMREHLKFDGPLVIDDVFGHLDLKCTATIWSLLSRRVQQLIVLCDELSLARIRQLSGDLNVIQLPG